MASGDNNVKKLRVAGSLLVKEAYSGETEVTPKDTEQTLSTAGTMLRENITINPIPYAEVSNDSGGKTITIGG